MSIAFDDRRWARVTDAYSRWWADELDRPLIAATLTGFEPRMPRPAVPLHGFHSFHGLDTPADQVIDTWQWTIEERRPLGDAFPAIWPNFGAGVLAVFLGCELENGIDAHTTWFRPGEMREADAMHFTLAVDSPWFRRVREIMQAADQRFGGRVQIGMTDLGGNLDILSSFRPGERLLLDLYDAPDAVERLTWQAHEAWWAAFEALHAALPHNRGYTAWTPIFSTEPYYMLQCDFSYMISPDMFVRFAKPELAASCRRLKNAFYHLDGPGQLPHLDALLEIPELKGIQWVPGAGQPDITHWPEVYRKIRRAGKRIQFDAGQSALGPEALDVLADQLGTARGVIMTATLERQQEDRCLRLLDRFRVDY